MLRNAQTYLNISYLIPYLGLIYSRSFKRLYNASEICPEDLRKPPENFFSWNCNWLNSSKFHCIFYLLQFHEFFCDEFFNLDQNGSIWFELDPNLWNLFKLVQTCSNLFKPVQTWSNLIKMDQIGLNLIQIHETCSNWIKLDQTCSNLIKMNKIGSK